MFEGILAEISKNEKYQEIKDIITCALEEVLKINNINTGKEAINYLTKRLSTSGLDESIRRQFVHIMQKELGNVSGKRKTKSKIKALKKIWEIEIQTLFSRQKRTKWVSVRLTEDEYNLVVKQARKEGLSISDYVRKKLGF
ncbi:plasmid mobilization protein [Palaeococcus sp. (in: euryarchaeotes)]